MNDNLNKQNHCNKSVYAEFYDKPIRFVPAAMRRRMTSSFSGFSGQNIYKFILTPTYDLLNIRDVPQVSLDVKEGYTPIYKK